MSYLKLSNQLYQYNATHIRFKITLRSNIEHKILCTT